MGGHVCGLFGADVWVVGVRSRHNHEMDIIVAFRVCPRRILVGSEGDNASCAQTSTSERNFDGNEAPW
jgi:hypothetical protein